MKSVLTLSILIALIFSVTGCADTIAVKPDNLERCQQLSESRKYDDAITCYGEVIANNPNSASAYYHRGGEYSVKGDYVRALQDFDQAIKLEPTSSDAHTGRGIAR
ncbi:MAG: tetratricopeptide repeat protein, partial [Burkholderiales bacterium]|nr:tetratricopeptide repeat protein [Burkholderiales bacterium]